MKAIIPVWTPAYKDIEALIALAMPDALIDEISAEVTNHGSKVYSVLLDDGRVATLEKLRFQGSPKKNDA